MFGGGGAGGGNRTRAPRRTRGADVETEITLDDSPTGPNEPFYTYRTRGPECDVSP